MEVLFDRQCCECGAIFDISWNNTSQEIELSHCPFCGSEFEDAWDEDEA
jgi:predicted  nucleic acid-binding Zn-ribbon protein